MTIDPFNITLSAVAGDAEDHIDSDIQGLTLGGWWYFDNAASADEYLMARWEGANTSYRLLRLAAGTIRGSVDSGGVVNVTTTATVGATAWTWIVFRFDPSNTLDLFINREQTTLAAGVPATIDSTPTTPFVVGADSAHNYNFDGRASMLFVCTAALPDVTIVALYDRSKAAYNVRN